MYLLSENSRTSYSKRCDFFVLLHVAKGRESQLEFRWRPRRRRSPPANKSGDEPGAHRATRPQVDRSALRESQSGLPSREVRCCASFYSPLGYVVALSWPCCFPCTTQLCAVHWKNMAENVKSVLFFEIAVAELVLETRVQCYLWRLFDLLCVNWFAKSLFVLFPDMEGGRHP